MATFLGALLAKTSFDDARFRIVMRAMVLFAVCMTANPFVRQNSDHLTGRFMLTSHLQLAVLVGGIVAVGNSKYLGLALSLLTCLGIVGITEPSPAPGLNREFLARRSELMSALSVADLPKDAVVIAPQRDEFLVTFIADVRSTQRWMPREKSRVLWLLDLPDGMRRIVQLDSIIGLLKTLAWL